MRKEVGEASRQGIVIETEWLVEFTIEAGGREIRTVELLTPEDLAHHGDRGGWLFPGIN